VCVWGGGGGQFTPLPHPTLPHSSLPPSTTQLALTLVTKRLGPTLHPLQMRHGVRAAAQYRHTTRDRCVMLSRRWVVCQCAGRRVRGRGGLSLAAAVLLAGLLDVGLQGCVTPAHNNKTLNPL
jgi:hypothetical protein